MSTKKKILIQIDPDPQPSVFDAVVAVDSGVDQLLSHGGVAIEEVEGLVHGAIFTRGPGDLKSTALFFGGANVAKTQQLVDQAKSSFFGPMRVSMMSDPNGSNTTAAAAVICASRHADLATGTVTILGATGPVGQRIAQIIAGIQGATTEIRICSRTLEKANVCGDAVASVSGDSKVKLQPTATPDQEQGVAAIAGSQVVFAAGAAGVQLLGLDWKSADLQAIIDLNAVPPAGVEGVRVTDDGREDDGCFCYGAIGVGGLKMKIHKQCIRELFDSNDRILETSEIFAIGQRQT